MKLILLCQCWVGIQWVCETQKNIRKGFPVLGISPASYCQPTVISVPLQECLQCNTKMMPAVTSITTYSSAILRSFRASPIVAVVTIRSCMRGCRQAAGSYNLGRPDGHWAFVCWRTSANSVSSCSVCGNMSG